MRTRLAVAVLFAVLAASQPAAAQPTAEVNVRNNAFDPIVAEVDRGGTVTWRLLEGQHTVTSDVAGGFDSGPLELGQPFSFKVPDEDRWIYYYCRIHGSPGDGTKRGVGMWGAIKVGSPPPPPPANLEVRTVPSLAWPTLEAALGGLNEVGPTRIELAAGTHRVERELTPATLRLGIPGQKLSSRFELTIRGVGDGVVIEGGIAAALDGLHLDNVTITEAPFAAVLFWRGMQRWSVDRVRVSDAGNYGIRVERDARRGRIGDVTIAGARIAAISVASCVDCDIVIQRADVRGNLAGLSALNAGGLVVTESTFADNGVGIALKTSAGAEAPVRGAHLTRNTITNSTVRPSPMPSASTTLDLPVGAGVWLAGASFATVESNTIDGSSFGVVVTGPAYADRIIGNVVSGSIEADVAWDGVGANVCFAGNTAPDGSAATTMPPQAETLYACALPATVGIPMPLVTARVLAWGLAAP